MAEDKFSWSDGGVDIVFPTEQGVAVYENGHGHLVIRQESIDQHEEDAFVIVPKHRTPALIAALTRALGQPPVAVGAKGDRRPA